jgi:NitT/TauT family transport system ATP-binding protein
MFQETALFPRFAVLRNVIFGLKLRDDLSDAERRRIAHQHLELVEPDKFAHANVHEFSGGMKRRERRRPGD